MKNNKMNPLMLLLLIVPFLFPKLRRWMMFGILKNRLIRNMGIQFILSIPFLRDRMMGKILPTRQTTY